MTNEYEINAINKPNRNSSHDHITHIGNNYGDSWRITREKAITMIDLKTASFYVIDRTTNKKVYIYVVRDGYHIPYIRTISDGKWSDNLLALPECIGKLL